MAEFKTFETEDYNEEVEKQQYDDGRKFSLIELLMIIMLVGIIFTLIIPLRNDKINREKVREAVYNLQYIAKLDEEFHDNPDNGYYAYDLSMLNIKKDQLKKFGDKYLFDYALTDSAAVAITNENFGKKGAEILYYLPNGPFQVKDKSVIDPNWLP
jgi:Tfp pilus assembly protein PilE